MKKIITLTLVIVVLFSCKKKSNNENLNLETEEEFVDKVYSEVLIKNQDFDFGLISVNDTILHTYKVKNVSEEPLIISRVISNCDCVEIDYSKKTLQKNQELDVSTKFIAKKDNLGSINILMLIECNSLKGAEVISMSGFVSDTIK